MERPLDTHRHGDVATYTMLTAAQRAGVRRFVYSSSSSVYGGEGPFPQTEQSPPVPKSPYAATKLCGEIYVRVFARAFGLDGVSLRYFNVFGPRQPARGGYAAVFPAMITRMMKGEAPVIYGDGAQTRDFTYVANVVAANLAAADAAQPLGGAALNVGAGARTSVLELAQRLNRAMGTDLAPEHIGSRPGDVKDSWADVSLAQRLIDYRPVVDIDEGLMRTVEWYCSQ
jgi:UDP-glucose 4-epimerase